MTEYNSQIQLFRSRERDQKRQMKQSSFEDFAARKDLFNSKHSSGRKNRIQEI